MLSHGFNELIASHGLALGAMPVGKTAAEILVLANGIMRVNAALLKLHTDPAHVQAGFAMENVRIFALSSAETSQTAEFVAARREWQDVLDMWQRIIDDHQSPPSSLLNKLGN